MATAKKIPDSNYQVQLTLSPKEARLIQLVIGRTTSSGPLASDVYAALREINGWMPNDKNGYPNLHDYQNFSKFIRDWVENGE